MTSVSSSESEMGKSFNLKIWICVKGEDKYHSSYNGSIGVINLCFILKCPEIFILKVRGIIFPQQGEMASSGLAQEGVILSKYSDGKLISPIYKTLPE